MYILIDIIKIYLYVMKVLDEINLVKFCFIL